MTYNNVKLGSGYHWPRSSALLSATLLDEVIKDLYLYRLLQPHLRSQHFQTLEANCVSHSGSEPVVEPDLVDSISSAHHSSDTQCQQASNPTVAGTSFNMPCSTPALAPLCDSMTAIVTTKSRNRPDFPGLPLLSLLRLAGMLVYGKTILLSRWLPSHWTKTTISTTT